MKSALKRLVRIARITYLISEQIHSLGMGDDPFFTIYGETMEAIYALLKENTETIEESVTYQTIHCVDLTDDECADLLAKTRVKNRIPA